MAALRIGARAPLASVAAIDSDVDRAQHLENKRIPRILILNQAGPPTERSLQQPEDTRLIIVAIRSDVEQLEPPHSSLE